MGSLQAPHWAWWWCLCRTTKAGCRSGSAAPPRPARCGSRSETAAAENLPACEVREVRMVFFVLFPDEPSRGPLPLPLPGRSRLLVFLLASILGWFGWLRLLRLGRTDRCRPGSVLRAVARPADRTAPLASGDLCAFIEAPWQKMDEKKRGLSAGTTHRRHSPLLWVVTIASPLAVYGSTPATARQRLV